MIATAAGLLNGTTGLALGYAAVAAPMTFGMIRHGAVWRRVLIAPVMAVPVTLAAGVGLGVLSSLGAAAGLGGTLSVGFGAAASVGLGYLCGRALARPRPDLATHRRGTVVLENGAAADSPRTAGRGGAVRNRAITVGAVALSESDETKHFKIIGTTGTGKSTAISEILRTALARGDRAVIADPDGGYLRRFGSPARADVILNPFEPASRKWDLFGEIHTPYDIEQLSRSLIPDHEGTDRSWRGYARTFLTAVTRRAHEAGVTDVGELHRLLVVAEPRGAARTAGRHRGPAVSR